MGGAIQGVKPGAATSRAMPHTVESENVPSPLAVTVVIVTFNSAEVLPDCLASVGAAMESVGPYEVVIADNASSDASSTLGADLLPQAKIVQLGRNLGYAAGINAALAVSQSSDSVLVLNPDVRLAPGSVGKLLSALSHHQTGIAVPRIIGPDGRLEYSLRREPTVLRVLGEALLGGRRAGRWPALGEVVSDPALYEVAQVVDWSTGAVMLISRRCIEAVTASRNGPDTPWDESFFLYSEETEFALRARDAGFALRYIPDAVAQHLGGESTTSSALWAILARNKVVLHRRRHGRLAAAAFWAAVVLNEALRAHRSATHRAALRALFRRYRPAPASGTPAWVCFSAQDWWYHNRAHSDFQLMTRVAQTRQVLFVNSISMRMPLPGRSSRFLRRLARKALSMARQLRRPVAELPNFHVLTPVIAPFYGSRLVRALNASLVRRQVAFHARRLGFTRPVIMVTIPTAWDVVAPVARRSLLFNRSDKHSAFGEVDAAMIAGLERQLLEHSDVVLYVSRSLMADEASLTGDRSVFLDHGVDLDHFRRHPPGDEPTDLAEIPRPRIGFFGGLDDYVVDFDLLQRLAEEIPEASLVLVGDATCSMRRFDTIPNVYWLGYRPYEEIPHYGSGFDVAIMPWLVNDWIKHCNPIKLKEYLALSLPVVTTPFPEASFYADVIAIAENADEFVAEVRRALADDAPAAARRARREAVAGASWDRRAMELLTIGENGISTTRQS